MVRIENELLTVNICRKGAELRSLEHRDHQIQYLWNGDPTFWGKYAPILFPIVGTLMDDRYLFEGKTYKLPRHGFARDKVFTLIHHTDSEAHFELLWDEETLSVYPFRFRLQLQYSIQGNSLTLTHVVRNEGAGSMWFSIGGHPAFKLPLLEDESYSDYSLHFFPKIEPFIHPLKHGYLQRQTIPVGMAGNTLALSKELFEKDALVFRDIDISHLQLTSKNHPHGLRFDMQGWPHLGLWAAPNAPFLCIEPWCGHADFIDHHGELTTKEGMIKLEPDERWEKAWTVTCS